MVGSYNENAQAVWDFVRCQRPDGSFYGSPSGKCRKGVEVGAEKEEKKKPVKSKEKEETTYNPEKAFEEGGRRLGKGIMGEVKLSKGPPPSVVKKGMIGQYEAEALKILQDSGVTPKLYGVVTKGQKKKVMNLIGGHVTESNGYLGMSAANGKPLVGQIGKMTPKQRQEAISAYLDVRKAIHTRGVAHNDMHDQNFFYDPKTKKGNIVDFGLSQVNWKAALTEALGTGRGTTMSKGDPMSDLVITKLGKTKTRGTNLKWDNPKYKRLNENIKKVERILAEEGHKRFPNRMTRQPISKHNAAAPKLTDERARELVEMLYDGV